MRRKVLSLELIQTIVDNAGPVLRNNPHFSQAIKKDLFISLLVNGVSPLTKIFRASLNIFNGLISNFKEFLRNEIGVFFSKILLCILASSNSSVVQKQIVLKLLLTICKQPQTLVDIFLNYDCQLESDDLFERMVNELASIAKSTTNENSITFQQETAIKVFALDCLVTIMKSLVNWSAELSEDEDVEDKLNLVEDESINLELSVHNGHNNSSNNINEANGHDLSQFKSVKQKKQHLENGKKLFKFKPKQAIQYFIEHNIVQSDARSVANFLYNEDVDKTMKGEYLGNIIDSFCKLVLYEYIDLHRFKGLRIDIALRKFLDGFRLPGESQKIDAIMEKFAERYYNDNKDDNIIFSSADSAYVFAYHIIMLTTDLHNRVVRVKMTKQNWIKNNTGLNDGKDFSEAFLVEIYDSILANEIKTKDNNLEKINLPNDENVDLQQKKMLFHKETKFLVKRSQELINEKLQDKSTFFKSTNIQHVKPMFELCWCPMIAAFSVMFELNEPLYDQQVCTLCLEGFRSAIRVSSIFYMEVERNAFITSLSQFTQLLSLREMKMKNIEAFRLMIQIALENGNYLHDSWGVVLSCISQLSKYLMLANGQTKKQLDPAPLVKKTTSEKIFKIPEKIIGFQGSPQVNQNQPNSPSNNKAIEDKNILLIAEKISKRDVDKVFSKSAELNNSAIVDFIRHLCFVSDSEVSNQSEPRVYSLQKLIEIAYFNMERIRFVWSQIWELLADHIVRVGGNENPKVASFAIDSLRQLSLKFLEKKELSHFHFQNEFLRPFEQIFNTSQFDAIKELIVTCLSDLISAKAENIKSGWKTIFKVLSFAANQENEKIITNAMEITENIVNHHFIYISELFFIECVNCLIEFASNTNFPEISKRALQSIKLCADNLTNNNVIMLANNLDSIIQDGEGNIIFTKNELHLQLWMPILLGLSKIIHHHHIEVRLLALTNLFVTLQSTGSRFSNEFWEIIFQEVLLPIFSFIDVEKPEDAEKLHDWLTTISLKVLQSFIDLFSQIEKIDFLLEDLLILFTKCILHTSEMLSSTAITIFIQFVMTKGSSWSPSTWNSICDTFYFISANIMPVELLTIGDPKEKIQADRTNYIQLLSTENPLNFDDVLPQSIREYYESFISYENVVLNARSSNDDQNNELQGEGDHKHQIIEKFQKNVIRRKVCDIKIISGRCNVELGITEGIRSIIMQYYSILSVSHLIQFFYSLKISYKFSKMANNRSITWKATSKSGIMQQLMRIECLSVSHLLDVLFKAYSDEDQEKSLFAEQVILK